MAEEVSLVEAEINGHVTGIDSFVEAIKSLDADPDYNNVVKRFVRDCEILKTDMFESSEPSNCDLVDFSDRYNSLEVQFHNIKRDHQ